MSALVKAAAKKPVFTQEGPQLYQAAFARNAKYTKPGPLTTALSPFQDLQFRAWLDANKVPFDATSPVQDYDMRGYFQQTHGAPHQPGTHFPDTFKTPYDTTFSGESQYAKPGTPLVWRGNTLVDTRTGEVVFK